MRINSLNTNEYFITQIWLDKKHSTKDKLLRLS